MCAPNTYEFVQSELSRRGFLATGAVLAAAGAAAAKTKAPVGFPPSAAWWT